MATLVFTVVEDLDQSPQAVFAALIDWRGHADWVPVTRVHIISGDGGVGSEFIATTGVPPFALPDRMRVTALDPLTRQVSLVKTGPILTGDVVLSVSPGATPAGSTGSAHTCRVRWHEEIRVPLLPQFLAGLVASVTAAGFRISLRRLERQLARPDEHRADPDGHR